MQNCQTRISITKSILESIGILSNAKAGFEFLKSFSKLIAFRRDMVEQWQMEELMTQHGIGNHQNSESDY